MTDHNITDITDQERPLTVDDVLALTSDGVVTDDRHEEDDDLDPAGVVEETWSILETSLELMDAGIENAVAKRLALNEDIKIMREARAKLQRMVRIAREA